jgi:Transposase domain (DUF772)
LPEAHLARYVVDVVEGLYLSALLRAYAGCGSDAYHPATLLSLLIVGYATGTFSRRKIERATYDSLAFRYIACNRPPDLDTLAIFRKCFGQEFQATLEVAREYQHSRFGAVKAKIEERAKARDQGGGFEQCYDAQAVVDTESMLHGT